MRAIRTLIALSVAAVAGACASPANTNAAASAGTTSTPMAMAAPGPMAATEPGMKAMHEMHQEMAKAGTAAGRQALMADRMPSAATGR